MHFWDGEAAWTRLKTAIALQNIFSKLFISSFFQEWKFQEEKYIASQLQMPTLPKMQMQSLSMNQRQMMELLNMSKDLMETDL